MGLVLACISLGVALIACWFTAEALRRAESNGDAVVKPHLRNVNARLRESRSLIDEMDSRLRRIERQVEVLKIDHRAAQGLDDQTRELRKTLDQARDFVPTRAMSA
ncbi:MAG: hypothetical protein HQ483_04065 [Rhodospirillales bacterium]|nr:hypothetical protein [Rhodospirillales bacterium]